ncbi:hypothetical protein GCM10010182_66980 [Actinomadura cremea]|nr:hypothetical protein GCM10010182_66980 [Actinomadura cremea]
MDELVLSERFLGRFRELPHGTPDGPSLRAAVRPRGDEHEELLVRYLRAGTMFAVTTSLVPDVLSDSEKPIARLAILTDGQWFWSSDLAHYVERYHVRLDPRFVHQVRAREGDPPELSEAEIESLISLHVGDAVPEVTK